jgi:hypothetical protein
MQPDNSKNKTYSLLKKSTRVFLLLLTLFCVYAVIIEVLIQQKKSKQTITTEYWSHRGRNNAGLPENSIAAFENVLQQGVTGIEVDVFWDETTKQMLVTHDTPQPGKQYTQLKDIIARFRDSTSYWIDYKNLTSDNVNEVQEQLSQLAVTYNVQNKMYVESGNGMALRKMNATSIRTLYWVQYGRSFPKRPFKLLYIKSLIVFSKFYGYTSSYSLMDDDFKKQFGGLPLFIFHATAQKLRKESAKLSTVQVQLVDEDYLKLLKP